MDGTTLYEGDVVLWSQEQAAALRAGDFSRLDTERLADEIEDVGKSEKRALTGHMAVLICHLLKWTYQADRRGNGWSATIREQRKEAAYAMKESPSLKAVLRDPDWRELVWLRAVAQAMRETQLNEDVFPETCPWSYDQVLAPDWLPA